MSVLSLRFPDEVTACPACGSPRLELLDVVGIPRQKRRRSVVFISGCVDCGVLFSNPLPTHEQLEHFYSDTGAWNVGHAEKQARLEKIRTRAQKQSTRSGPAKVRPQDLLLRAIGAWVPIDAPPHGSRVLDFGCGDGKMLNRLQDRGWDTFGIEPSTDVAFLRHHRLAEPPADGRFDFVILHHVLEHVLAPLQLLQQIAAATREGGMLFLSVPRWDTLPEHGDYRYCINGRNHLTCFTETSLRTLLARAGFEVVARLDDTELDQVLSDGQPLRLRLMARRTASPPAGPPAPLEPARAALKSYRLRFRPDGSGLMRLLPVRMRAALLDRARRT